LFYQTVSLAASHLLFQNKFFTLSTDASLLCTTSKNGFLSIDQLQTVITYYEQHNPSQLRHNAIALLTDHHQPDHLEDLQDYQQSCDQDESPDLCLLEHYWDNKEAALRALALFYDTKTIIKHGEYYAARRFNQDHLRVFEKAIRKIPVFIRHNISQAKPLDQFDKVIGEMDQTVQTLIQEAYPDDFSTSIWSDNTHPLTFVPGVGFRSQVVAQVYNGQNLIIFTVKAFDKGKEGRLYRDIDLAYLVDFRLPIVVHEIAHTIDNFHFWNGKDELYFFFSYRKLSNDNQLVSLIKQAKLALWPSKWFEAFEFLWEVNQGRYDGQIQEKVAELVAQYILIPERLKQSAPQAYAWLRHDLFRGIEYQGYDRCPQAITRPLTWWEEAIAKKLGQLQ